MMGRSSKTCKPKWPANIWMQPSTHRLAEGSHGQVGCPKPNISGLLEFGLNVDFNNPTTSVANAYWMEGQVWLPLHIRNSNWASSANRNSGEFRYGMRIPFSDVAEVA